MAASVDKPTGLGRWLLPGELNRRHIRFSLPVLIICIVLVNQYQAQSEYCLDGEVLHILNQDIMCSRKEEKVMSEEECGKHGGTFGPGEVMGSEALMKNYQSGTYLWTWLEEKRYWLNMTKLDDLEQKFPEKVAQINKLLPSFAENKALFECRNDTKAQVNDSTSDFSTEVSTAKHRNKEVSTAIPVEKAVSTAKLHEQNQVHTPDHEDESGQKDTALDKPSIGDKSKDKYGNQIQSKGPNEEVRFGRQKNEKKDGSSDGSAQHGSPPPQRNRPPKRNRPPQEEEEADDIPVEWIAAAAAVGFVLLVTTVACCVYKHCFAAPPPRAQTMVLPGPGPMMPMQTPMELPVEMRIEPDDPYSARQSYTSGRFSHSFGGHSQMDSHQDPRHDPHSRQVAPDRSSHVYSLRDYGSYNRLLITGGGGYT